ncbi:MAG TPA: hypothetical protein VGE34_01045 [Candidatus Saccharimonadales bacterium]
MTARMEGTPMSGEASKRESLSAEIVEGLPFLSIVQLQGVLTIIRARRSQTKGDVDA